MKLSVIACVALAISMGACARNDRCKQHTGDGLCADASKEADGMHSRKF